jgi:hypothetical protein
MRLKIKLSGPVEPRLFVSPSPGENGGHEEQCHRHRSATPMAVLVCRIGETVET